MVAKNLILRHIYEKRSSFLEPFRPCWNSKFAMHHVIHFILLICEEITHCGGAVLQVLLFNRIVLLL